MDVDDTPIHMTFHYVDMEPNMEDDLGMAEE